MFIKFCKSICQSKAAQTLFCLLVCILIIVLFVVLMETVEKSQEAEGKNEKFAVSPHPNPTIHYKFKKSRSIDRMVNKIQDFLEDYRTFHVNQVNCSFNSTERKPGHSCKVDLNSFGPCVEKEQFGYARATPCIFIKFKKILKWVPESYDLGDLNETDIGSDFIDFIESEVTTKGDKVLNMIWAKCQGKTLYDTTLLGSIDYYPWRGFPAYFFPYNNETRFSEPLMAIQLKNARPGIFIDVECSFYARNFKEVLSFSILIDDYAN